MTAMTHAVAGQGISINVDLARLPTSLAIVGGKMVIGILGR